MTHAVYSKQQLELKKLNELKAIASAIGAVASDKRSKQSWIDAILDKQPVKAEGRRQKAEGEEVKSNLLPPASCLLPSFDVDGDEVKVDEVAIATITLDDNLTQPWVVTVDGAETHRAGTWAQCYNYVRWHYKNGTLSAPATDDYLFHEEIQPEIKLPKVGDTYSTGDSVLRCVEVGGDRAAVWSVYNDGLVGEISMGWDCFWSHPLSSSLFATPQEAIADLLANVARNADLIQSTKNIDLVQDESPAFREISCRSNSQAESPRVSSLQFLRDRRYSVVHQYCSCRSPLSKRRATMHRVKCAYPLRTLGN